MNDETMRELIRQGRGPTDTCGHVRTAGSSGYAPIVWTRCSDIKLHGGLHSGPEFGNGELVKWS